MWGFVLTRFLITIFTSLGALISYSFLGCNSSKDHSIFISNFSFLISSCPANLFVARFLGLESELLLGFSGEP